MKTRIGPFLCLVLRDFWSLSRSEVSLSLFAGTPEVSPRDKGTERIRSRCGRDSRGLIVSASKPRRKRPPAIGSGVPGAELFPRTRNEDLFRCGDNRIVLLGAYPDAAKFSISL